MKRRVKIPNIGSRNLKRAIFSGDFIMVDFENYVTRHGEDGTQDLIERLERYERIPSRVEAPLEDRWNILMFGTTLQNMRISGF